MDRCSAGAVVKIPAMVSHHNRNKPTRPPLRAAWSRCSLNACSISDSNSPRKSNGNKRSNARYMRSDKDSLRWFTCTSRLCGLKSPQQVFLARGRYQTFHAFRLADRRFAAGWSYAVIAAPLIVFLGRRTVAALFDQPFVQQPLDDRVQRASAEPYVTAALLLDIFQNRVAVFLVIAQCQQHLEHRRSQGPLKAIQPVGLCH